MHNDEGFLKTDVLGRVRTPPERREALLVEFERSGVPALKFAALVGVNYQTFATWVQKRRRKAGTCVRPSPVAKKPPAQNAMLGWVEAVAGPATSLVHGAGLRVQFSGGAYLDIVDESGAVLAAQLLRALGMGTTGTTTRAC